MKVIFFHLFVLFLHFFSGDGAVKKRHGYYEPFRGQNNFKKYVGKEKRSIFPTPFVSYPKKIPSFVDDTYCKYILVAVCF